MGRGYIISVALCFIWLSVFINVYTAVDSIKTYRISLHILNITGLCVSASVFASYLWGDAFGELVYQSQSGFIRAFGPLGDNVGFIISFFILNSFVKRSWMIFSFHLGAILLTSTRGAMIGAILGIIYLGFSNKEIRFTFSNYYKLAIVWGVAIGVIGWYLSVAETTTMRLSDYDTIESTASDRIASMKAGFMLFLENPIIGAGFGSFRDYAKKYQPLFDIFHQGIFDRQTYTAANQYIQMATDSGVIGLFILICFLLIIFKNSYDLYGIAASEFKNDILVFQAYFIAIFIGNVAAVWWLNNNTAGYFVLLVAGLSERINFLLRKELRDDAAISSVSMERR